MFFFQWLRIPCNNWRRIVVQTTSRSLCMDVPSISPKTSHCATSKRRLLDVVSTSNLKRHWELILKICFFSYIQIFKKKRRILNSRHQQNLKTVKKKRLWIFILKPNYRNSLSKASSYYIFHQKENKIILLRYLIILRILFYSMRLFKYE